MTIAVFFGSFNPIHQGHVSIAECFLAEDRIDEVWLSVSPQNPWKEANGLMPMNDRVAMCRLATEGDSRIRIIDFEKDLPQPSYTYEALCELKSRFTQHQFILIIGGDNCESFHLWRNYDKILNDFEVWAYPRDEKRVVAVEGIKLIEAPLLDVSSTQIRSQMSSESDVIGIDEKVKLYLSKISKAE